MSKAACLTYFRHLKRNHAPTPLSISSDSISPPAQTQTLTRCCPVWSVGSYPKGWDDPKSLHIKSIYLNENRGLIVPIQPAESEGRAWVQSPRDGSSLRSTGLLLTARTRPAPSFLLGATCDPMRCAFPSLPACLFSSFITHTSWPKSQKSQKGCYSHGLTFLYVGLWSCRKKPLPLLDYLEEFNSKNLSPHLHPILLNSNQVLVSELLRIIASSKPFLHKANVSSLIFRTN